MFYRKNAKDPFWDRYRKFRWYLGFILLFLSLTFLIWAYLPQSRQHRLTSIILHSNNSLEKWSVTITWTSRMHLGDSGEVNLAMTPYSQNSYEGLSSESLEKDRFIEARLELPGLPYIPQGEVRQALFPGRPLFFIWRFQPEYSEVFPGELWLHLSQPAGGIGDQQRVVLTAQKIGISVSSFLGLNIRLARTLGVIGIILGFFLLLDGVISWLIRIVDHRSESFY